MNKTIIQEALNKLNNLDESYKRNTKLKEAYCPQGTPAFVTYSGKLHLQLNKSFEQAIEYFFEDVYGEKQYIALAGVYWKNNMCPYLHGSMVTNRVYDDSHEAIDSIEVMGVDFTAYDSDEISDKAQLSEVIAKLKRKYPSAEITSIVELDESKIVSRKSKFLNEASQKDAFNYVLDDTLESWTNVPKTVVNVFCTDDVKSSDLVFLSYKPHLRNVTLPSNLNYIAAKSFTDCESLKNIELPATVHKLGKQCFDGCVSLQNLDLSNVKYFDFACLRRTALSNIDLQNAIDLDQQAFQSMKSLKEIVLPENVEYVGPYCFAECFNLQTVTILNSSIFLGLKCFKKCVKLTTVITVKDGNAEKYFKENHPDVTIKYIN